MLQGSFLFYNMKADFHIGDIVKIASEEKFRELFPPKHHLVVEPNLFKIFDIDGDTANINYSLIRDMDNPIQIALTELAPVSFDKDKDVVNYIVDAIPIAAPSGCPEPLHVIYYPILDANSTRLIDGKEIPIRDIIKDNDIKEVHELQHFLREKCGIEHLNIQI